MYYQPDPGLDAQTSAVARKFHAQELLWVMFLGNGHSVYNNIICYLIIIVNIREQRRERYSQREPQSEHPELKRQRTVYIRN